MPQERTRAGFGYLPEAVTARELIEQAHPGRRSAAVERLAAHGLGEGRQVIDRGGSIALHLNTPRHRAPINDIWREQAAHPAGRARRSSGQSARRVDVTGLTKHQGESGSSCRWLLRSARTALCSSIGFSLSRLLSVLLRSRRDGRAGSEPAAELGNLRGTPCALTDYHMFTDSAPRLPLGAGLPAVREQQCGVAVRRAQSRAHGRGPKVARGQNAAPAKSPFRGRIGTSTAH